jgi:hypothetical protein
MPEPAYAIEPWPGYSAQKDRPRIATLQHKIGEARRRGDLLYALAICSAVAACEALERGEGEPNAVERTAASLGREIDSYGKQHLEDAGGWTPK